MGSTDGTSAITNKVVPGPTPALHPHYVFAKIWYIAQIFPASGIHTQRVMSAANFFILKGATFKVPVPRSKGTKPKVDGDW